MARSRAPEQPNGSPIRRHATTAGATLAVAGVSLIPYLLSQSDKIADMRAEVVEVRAVNTALTARVAAVEAAQKTASETMWPRISSLERDGAAGSSLMAEIKDRLNRVDAKLDKVDDTLRAMNEKR
jgi:hypothetical protein